VDEFFDQLLLTFPSEDSFSFVLDMIMILLRRGPERWKYPLFFFLPALLQRYTCSYSSDELVHLAELVIYFCHSSNERLASAAEELLPFVINQSQLCSIPLALFTFVRKAPPAIYSTKNKDLYNGDMKRDYKENVFEAVKNIYTKIFNLSSDSETFKTIDTKYSPKKAVKKHKKSKSKDKEIQVKEKSRSRESLLPSNRTQTLTKILNADENSSPKSKKERQFKKIY